MQEFNPSEELSGLLDDQSTSVPLDNLLAQYESDPQLRQTWTRYNLIRETMRQNLDGRVDLGLADRVAQAVAAEEPHAPAVVELRRPSTRARPIWGYALAASLGGAALLVSLGLNDASSPNRSEMVAEKPGVQSAPVGQVVATQVPLRSTDPSQVNGYLVNHSKGVNGLGVRGTLPYVRVVSHKGQ